MSGCHLWLGNVHHSHGYDRARVFNGEKWETAPRFVWRTQRGPIPEDKHVLHTCDNSLCVNLDHLYLGDDQQNVDDRERRGRFWEGRVEHIKIVRIGVRHQRGEEHHRAKLTWSDVRAIRASPLSRQELAKQYGVDPVHIWNIRAGKFWKE